MNKLLTFLLLLSFVQLSTAQFLWYENETNTNQIEFQNTTAGVFSTDVTNPDNTQINTNAIVSKFNRDESKTAFVTFDLFNPVIDFSGYSVTIKAYLDLPTESLTINNSRLRIYFTNSRVLNAVFKSVNFTVGQEWQTFTFNFDGTQIPQVVLDANGYDLMRVGFANVVIAEPAMTYYIDAISGTKEQVIEVADEPAAWLAGSWGVTFPVFGGARLEAEVAGGYDLPSGAQQVIDELPAVGHIITNLSYFAHSHYFTLRGNNNVDVATEIHESLVPSLENEAIIFEVLQKFKDSQKRVILYISTNYMDGADEETHAAWVNYYTSEFAGNEYLAYKDLIEGYIERVKDYADGYWLDSTIPLRDGGHLEDFVEMIRVTDPGAAITTSPSDAFFTENNELILVDADGIDDEDDTDYRIIKYEGVNTFQDYTSGHVTPLGQGAPPNSWAYEEFTIPGMLSNPWTSYQGNTVLKHAWFPVRARWHVPQTDLIFGTEDAYRFAKQIVDANAGVTFATTIDYRGSNKGYMMPEEMDIMKAINNRLLSNPVPDFEPYVRPEGAFLVGECASSMAINDLDIPPRIYQTTDYIVSSGSVLSGNEVTFDAKNSITLNAGFHAQNSSNFTAKIGGCESENLQAENYPINNTFKVKSPNTQTQAKEFSVFPNPTKDIIKIVSHSAANFDVQIVDVRGIEVLRKEFTQQAAVLDIQHFTKGMYFVTFINSATGEQFYKTIVKQ